MTELAGSFSISCNNEGPHGSVEIPCLKQTSDASQIREGLLSSEIRGDNSTVEYPLFQTECGGSSPTSPLHISQYRIRPCKWEELVPILEKYHYRRGMIGGSIKICLGVYCDGILIGGAVFGNPWHPDTYSEGGRHNCIELRRLCFLDEAPKNTESWTISRCLWWLKKYSPYTRVLSYSDTGAGHTGTIYRAAGFRLAGESEGGKKIQYQGRDFHIRSLSIDRDYARDLVKAVERGDAQVVDTGIKRIWIRDIADARDGAFNGYVSERVSQSTLF